MQKRRKLKKGILKRVAIIKKANSFSGNFQTTFSCSLKQKYNEIEIKTAEELVQKQKSRRKRILNISLLILNILIVGGFILYYGLTSGIVSFRELIYMNIDYKFLILAVVMVLCVNLFETLRFFYLLKKTTGKGHFWLSFRTHMYGRYYDTITPLSIGGEPFQIYYLNKHNIKGDAATSIPLVKNIYTNIANCIIGSIVLISNFIHPVTTSPFIIIIAFLGLLGSGTLIFLLLLFSINKRVGAGLVIGVLKLLNKLHLIKDYKKTFFKVNRFVLNYQKSMKAISKNVWNFLIQLFLTFCMYACYYLIIYFIYLAFLPLMSSSFTLSYTDIICCMSICDLCAGIMPLPAGTGLAEISFDNLFKSWFSITVFPWAMLIWRTLTCFIYLFVGVIQTICSFAKKNREIRKEKKK